MIFPRLTLSLLLVALPAVFSQCNDEGVRATDDDCVCSKITLLDGNSGEIDCDCDVVWFHSQHFYFHREEYWQLSLIIQWQVLVLRNFNKVSLRFVLLELGYVC